MVYAPATQTLTDEDSVRTNRTQRWKMASCGSDLELSALTLGQPRLVESAVNQKHRRLG